ncbi:Z804B protein, partial [Chroicocephalus maculipennis]|nr:Z804B protein [Chroicocephalus maculipennis]
DYAEKEKAAAKALEDVKANFYCELCDKQYHKHQEFDNHINSYDHAHKQRLKDLKQREFARNVASKSWKDEKKQEKALKRLHQLAELRKHITGSGPLLKAPRLVVEKQQSPDGIFLYKGGKFTASSQRTATSEGQGFSSGVLEKQQFIISRHQYPTERPHGLGNQVSQVFPDNSNASQRAGVSFSFSKKVPLKLESSASVFSENSEEGYDCSESPNHKTKQALEGFHSGTLLEEDVKAGLDKGPSVTQDQMNLDNSALSHVAAKPKMLHENDKSSDRELEEKVSAHPSFSKVKIQLSNLDFSDSLRETEQESKSTESEQLLETLISPSCQASNFCTQPNTYKHSNAHLPGQLPELPQQPEPQLACASNSPGVIKRERSLESSETTNGNMETLPRETMVKEVKPQALPFLHVVSKDGTTALQWPTELLLFTKTEPCISYGCNPLYFDFRLSLNHRDGKQHETNKASCKEHSINKTADENEASGLIKHKQMSNEQDNQLLKPKKMKGSLNPRKAKQKAESDIGKETNENGQKCIADYLNENIPKVPTYLDVSRKDYVTEKSLHTTTLRRPLKHHFHSCERKKQNIRNESISFSAFMSRIKKSKAAKCHLIYSEEKRENQKDCRTVQDVASCNSDISDSGKDSTGSFLSYKSGSNSRYSENEGCGSYMKCWRFPSPQKSSSDRHSSYSDTSVNGMGSYMGYMSPTSNDHSRNHLLFCCKRKSKTAERHKCKHRKHKHIFTSDDTDEDNLCHGRTRRTRNCTQRGTTKHRRCSRHKVLQHRDRSKHSRRRHRHFGKAHSRSRSYHSSKSCSTRDSRSSERSSSKRISRGSSSGSSSKETDNCDNKTKEDTERGSNTEAGKAETAHYHSLNVNGQSKNFATCSSETLAKDICGKRKSLTAKLLLERVQSKKTQEQMHDSERFPNTCGVELKDHSRSQFALQFPSSGDDIAMLPLPEKLLSIGENDMGHNEISSLETSLKKNNFEASERTNVALSTGTNYDHCLFKDIIQIGTGYQSPSIKRNTAIKEQSNLFISEVQPFIQSCDPVPNDFPGAFPSNRYSVVANSTETKEELHDVNMDSNRAEGSLCDNAMQKYDDTVNDLEVYSKSTSPPLMQQPITFSPEEVDKYRLLQLQAQQHMQKQLLAKRLKVLPAPGPAAFSATPAVPALPVQQHATVTTIHHTLLQRFAVSASVHPHGSHLSLAHLHPLSQAHFAPISLSPLAPALIPTHPALLAGHPLHLVSTTPLHPSPLTFPTLPHTAYLPALFTPHLNAATPSAIHPNPLVHPLFQGQEPHHHSCSSQTQQLPTIKEVFSVSSYLN